MKCNNDGREFKCVKPSKDPVIRMVVRNKDFELPLYDPTEEDDVMFRVAIMNAQPAAVKVSKKNVCFVTVTPEDVLDPSADHGKLIEFFLNAKKPTWGEQFKNAILLGP